MSNTDSFVEEVTAELRRDRMSALWRRWGQWGIAGMVGIVGVAAVLTWLDHRTEQEAQAAGSRLIVAGQAATAETRALEFESLAETEPDPGPALVARLSQAAALTEAGNVSEALAIYDVVDSDASVDPLYRALAGFKAATLRAPGLDPEARAESFERFAFQGEPFRLLALEQRAVAFMEAGDLAAARREAETALSAPDLAPSLRDRLETLMSLLGDAPAVQGDSG